MANNAPTQQTNRKLPPMSFWQIWNMSFGFFGIQFGFELQNSNVSRIFETLGANKDEIPILWIAAPLTGLLVQPIIGYLSDRTWHPTWGRRRPFFFIGAVLSAIALFLMPNSSALWMAGGMLWILDASINISMEPFRAFVGDKLPSEQRTTGFAMQSFFIGVGSVIAALMPYILTNVFHFSNTAPSGQIPDSVKWSFYLGGIAFLGAVMYTVFTVKEFPPEDLEALKKSNRESTLGEAFKETFGGIFKMPKAMRQLAFVQFFTWFALFSMWIYSTNAVTSTIYDMKVDNNLYMKIATAADQMQANPTTSKDDQKTIKALQGDFGDIQRFQGTKDLKTISINIANFFAEEKHNKNLNPEEVVRLKSIQKNYNDGADWLSVCSSVRNGVAAIFAFIIPLIALRFGRRKTHLISLIIGGLGLISVSLIENPTFLAVAMGMVGIAWASILSMPYAILAGSLPAHRMGYFMGVFNFFIVIPQIVAATILGFFLTAVFNGNTMNTIILGGCSMILAGILTLIVEDKDDIN